MASRLKSLFCQSLQSGTVHIYLQITLNVLHVFRSIFTVQFVFLAIFTVQCVCWHIFKVKVLRKRLVMLQIYSFAANLFICCKLNEGEPQK